MDRFKYVHQDHQIFNFKISMYQVVFKVRLGTEYDVQQELSNFYSVEIAFVAAKSMPR